MKSIFLLGCCLVYSGIILAQDSTDTGKKRTRITDSLHAGHVTRQGSGKAIRPEIKKNDFYRDTIRRERRKFDSTLFTNINVSSTSDYAEDLGKVYEVLSDIPVDLSSFVRLHEIEENLDKEDSVLDIVKERMSRGEHTLNVRNLEMINTLLDALDRNTDSYIEYLNQYDSALDEVREQITDLRKDTLMLHIFRDTSLKNTFQPQLQQLKAKWREVDSLVTEDGQLINTLKFQSSAHAISIGELINRVDMSLKAAGSKALQKEQPYLWESRVPNLKVSEEDFRESFNYEQQLTRFYFANTRNNRLLLLFTGILFFFWISSNFRALRRLKKMEAIEHLHITYVHPLPFAASLVFMLSLAPFFDFHAPAIYIEFIQFLLIVVVTFILRPRIEPRLLYGWFLFILLFLIVPACRLFGMASPTQRWMYLITDIASVVLGFYFLFHLEKRENNWVIFAIVLYIVLNLLAIACNLLSRVTLSQIFSYTASYAFAQTISLGVFVQLVVESFLLQVQTSRMRKNYPEAFDGSVIAASMKRLSMLIAIILWLIVFTTNLNLIDAINDLLTNFFTKTRQVGNFSFTFGGILLFLGIIWLANFLQKYIAYFFGDTGDDASFDDKGQRSRLMVTRLILLTAGFLLAVAASGLAVDRITVILGALGVGVGLGLQGIVNNFVSGIILIFDRPLRIGDSVDIGGKKGRVKEISIRSSTLLTEEGAEIIIPNGDVLSQSIINWTLSNNHARVSQSFTIKKPENPENFDLKAINKIILGNKNVMPEKDPEIVIVPVNLKTSEIRIFFWIIDYNKLATTSQEIKTLIYEYLVKNGFMEE
jgi:small-conductance mechanosensitive channel